VLQAAVDAASDGDILLLQPGDYILGQTADGVIIDGKGITLIGDGTAPQIRRIQVLNLPAGKTVLLRQLEIRTFSSSFGGVNPPSLSIRDCAGSVWVEDCVIWGIAPTGYIPGADAIRVTDSDAVVVMRSMILGGMGVAACSTFCIWAAEPGGAGVHVIGSQASFHGCSLQGGRGGNGDIFGDPTAANGGPGLRVDDEAHVTVSDCTLTGGHGGNGTAAPQGGHGLWVIDGASRVWTLETTAEGGSPPLGGNTDIVAPPGTLVAFAQAARAMALTSPHREGEAGTLTITGAAGDFAGYFWGFAGDWMPLFDNLGVFSLASPFQGVFLLGVPPSDPWVLPITAPDMPAGIDGFTFLIQFFVQDQTTSQILAGATTTFVLIDSGL
jgi:hypothetical protein